MTRHAEIVVRAPDGHLALFLGAAWPPDRRREASRVAVDVDKDPIATLFLQALKRTGEMRSCELVECRLRTNFASEHSSVLTHDRTTPERRWSDCRDNASVAKILLALNLMI